MWSHRLGILWCKLDKPPEIWKKVAPCYKQLKQRLLVQKAIKVILVMALPCTCSPQPITHQRTADLQNSIWSKVFIIFLFSFTLDKQTCSHLFTSLICGEFSLACLNVYCKHMQRHRLITLVACLLWHFWKMLWVRRQRRGV